MQTCTGNGNGLYSGSAESRGIYLGLFGSCAFSGLIPTIGQYGIAQVQTTDDNGTYTTQEKIGGHPYVNIYANFFLKHTRFFVMLSHVNADMGSRNYFMTPHYPQNSRVLHFGLSWNFFN